MPSIPRSLCFRLCALGWMSVASSAWAAPEDCQFGAGKILGVHDFSTGADFSLEPDSVHPSTDGLADDVAWGDFNNDGALDIAVGAPFADRTLPDGTVVENAGATYVIYSAGPLVAAGGSLSMDQADVVFWGEGTTGLSGRDLTVGNFDGVGGDDLAIGNRSANLGPQTFGRVHVLFGVTIAAQSGDVTATDVADAIIDGRQHNVRFGWELLAAKMNSDGLDDLVISAYRGNHGQGSEGEVYVFTAPFSGTLTAGVDEQLKIYGGVSNRQLGASMANLGDLGDGYDTIAFGARVTDEVFLWTGGADLDVGQPALGALHTNNARKRARIFGGAEGFGALVSNAGDMTGDGVTDLWITANEFAYQNRGGLLLFSGADAIGDVDWNTRWATIQGSAGTIELGVGIASNVDFDGDGNLDVVGWGAKGSPDGKGAAFLYYGPFAQGTFLTTNAADARIDGADSSVYWNGNALHYQMVHGVDLDGDGYGDLLLANVWSDAHHTGGGAVSVFRGGEDGAVNWYADADGDGYGDPADIVWDCEAPAGYVQFPGPPPASLAMMDGVPVALQITSHEDGDGITGTTANVEADLAVGADIVDAEFDVALSVVMDLSPSALYPTTSEVCGDLNNDGMLNTDLDCQIMALEALVNQAVADESVDRMSLTFFEWGVAHADLSPAAGTQIFVAPDADENANGVYDILDVARSMHRIEDQFVPFAGPSAFTQYNVANSLSKSAVFGAAHQACNILSNDSAALKRIVLISDGYNNMGWNEETAMQCFADNGVAVTAFVTGTHSTAGCDTYYGTSGSNFGTTRGLVEPTGGTCVYVGDGAALPELLPGYVTPEVVAARGYIDGMLVPEGDVNVVPPVVVQGFGVVSLDLDVEGIDDHTRVCFEADVTYLGPTVTVGDCVSLFENLPPVANAGGDRFVFEGEQVTLDGSASFDVNGDPLTYSWSVMPVSGLPVTGSVRNQSMFSFAALDDGIYDVVLTVEDGWASTSDTVRVTVQNADPTVILDGHDGIGDGVASLAGRISDLGPLDVHTIEVDWGDGSQTEVFGAAAAGPGWSTFVGSHHYAAVGSYTALVTVTDGDGGMWMGTRELSVTEPVAVWAASATDRKSVEWSGCGGLIRGDVFSANDLWVGGGGKALQGRVVADDVHLRGDVALNLPPEPYVPGPAPVWFDMADWGPTGPEATALGAAYHDMTGACSGGVWTVSTTLDPGVYYANCDIDVQVSANATFVATGHVELSGTSVLIDAYTDALAVLAGSTEPDAVRVSGYENTVVGYLAAPHGGVEVGGPLFSLTCGAVGQTVDFAGSGLMVDATACSTANDGSLTPLLVPDVQLAVTATPANVLPGEAVHAETQITFAGATLVVPSVVGVRNLGTSAVTVTGADLTISTRPLPGDPWQSLPLPTAWKATPLAHGGGYAPELTQGGSAVVAGGEGATWSVAGMATAAGSDLTSLLATAAGGEIRAEMTLTIDNPDGVAVTLLQHGGSLSLDAGTVDLTDVELVMLTVDGGAVTYGASQVAALGMLSGEAGATVPHDATPAVLAGKSSSEGNPHYTARLLEADGQPLPTSAYAVASFQGLRVYAPFQSASVSQRVPVLTVSGELPDALVVATGDTVDLSATVSNVGGADAVSVGMGFDVSGDSVPHGLPTSLAAGDWAVANGSYVVPDSLADASASVDRTLAWQDGVGSTYGPLADEGGIEVNALPGLRMNLVDSILVDDGNGVFTDGDRLRLTLTVEATSSAPVSGVDVSLALDDAAAYVAASEATSAGTVVVDVTGSTPVLTANLGTVTQGSPVTITVDVDVDTGATLLVHQATADATGISSIVSDDPGASGAHNPTRTVLVPAGVELQADLLAFVVGDTDGNGGVSPGDVVHYQLTVFNRGLASQSAVDVVVPVPEWTTLVEGSLTTDADTIVTGQLGTDGEVHVSHATLGAVSSITLGFDVELALGSNIIGLVQTQGDVNTQGTFALATDDPLTAPVGDPTVLTVGDPSYPDYGDDYAGPFPTAEIVSPTDGARVATPMPVRVRIAPVAENDVQYWRLMLYPAEGSLQDAITLASAVPAPANEPGEDWAEVATLDPSTLANGLYTLQLDVIDTGGLMNTALHAVQVDGAYKPGRMQVAFEDFSMDLPTGNVSLVRSYDSLDRLQDGEFGHGWRLTLANITVQTNGPLGWNGWGRGACGGGFGFVNYCFDSAKPHFVLVTWPNGTTETFDMSIADTNMLAPSYVQPVFTSRTGASTLRVAPGDDSEVGLWAGANIKAGFAGQHGMFDPESYVLTAGDGTEYELNVDVGVTKVTDRFGNTMEITDDGVFLSAGPDISWTKTSEGYLDVVSLPDGTFIDYDYAAGNLVEVTDQMGHVTVFDYDFEHRLESWGGENAAQPLANIEYDPVTGRVLKQYDPSGAFIEKSYDDAILEVSTTSPDGLLVTVEAYGAEGTLDEVRQEFDDGAGVPQVYTTTYDYDDDFRVTDVVRPTGATVHVVYDDLGRVVSHTDEAGVVRTTEYGPYNQAAKSFVNGALVSERVFDPVTEMVIAELRGDGSVVKSYDFDPAGRLTRMENGEDEWIELDYGSGYLPTTITRAGPHEITVTYDGAGRPRVVKSDGVKLRETVYDNNGQTLQLIDGRDQVQAFTYDDQGRTLTYTDKLNETVVYTYDDVARTETRTNRLGQSLVMTMDVAGRTSSVTGPGVSKAFTYDALGRLLTAETPVHRITRTYDVHGLTSDHAEGLNADPHADTTLTVVHDDAGRLERLVGPSTLDVTYAYDADGTLDTATEALLGTYDFSHDVQGRMNGLARPSGATTTYGFDDANRVEAIDTLVGATPIHALAYVYDIQGQLERTTTTLGGGAGADIDYTHDNMGRLLTADHPAGSGVTDEAYTYDSAFRRTSSPGNPAADVIYDNGDRLLQDATYAYTYDDEGRRTERVLRLNPDTGLTPTDVYSWNSLDQLTGLVEYDGTEWRYVYDALDRRVLVERIDPYGTVSAWAFVYDENDLVRGVYDEQGTVLHEYVTGFGFGEVIADVSGGMARDAVRDKLGTVVAWLDGATGAIDEEVVRNSYGVRRDAMPEDVDPWGYTGHADDVNGLTWGRARYLETASGVWLSQDPVWTEPGYVYVRGASVRLSDIDGREASEYAITAVFATGAGCVIATGLGFMVAETNRVHGPGGNYSYSGDGYQTSEAIGACLTGVTVGLFALSATGISIPLMLDRIVFVIGTAFNAWGMSGY